ncbi:class I fructose-bisphosphate aldolase [Shouchella lehensis]|uniref:Phospho-2-dehydro-3-deoxyheptonate aldolase n=1 Tax=Shouchella lehensis TaxID=300825 RepID=A0A4Y7WHL2_9BACI|nr:phospho-2-dehydro-3-deoxyheptonate aldolase [Shouchella lehensis]MBG9782640.1 phospho-2-dehydro-3-deoxyheptonate aldolase [Shouchella lehensis]TES47744.1 phospho-2-dehydro-3-deoxyheptonate aldolase [Shouchella lehensis]
MTKKRRLARVFAQDGKSLTLALDGSYFSSKIEGIDKVIPLIPTFVKHGLDAVLGTYGMVKRYPDAFQDVGMMLRADMSTNVFDTSVPDTTTVLSVKEALRLSADGVIVMTFPGAHNEKHTHQAVRELASQADEWNVPLIVESLPYGYAVTTESSNHAPILAAAANMAVELGADVIKTRYSGEPDDLLIAQYAKVPVLALGGPKTDDVKAYLSFVNHCLANGAKGVAVGRNIVQNKSPVAMVAALNALIHKGDSVESAYQLYQTMCLETM